MAGEEQEFWVPIHDVDGASWLIDLADLVASKVHHGQCWVYLRHVPVPIVMEKAEFEKLSERVYLRSMRPKEPPR